MRVLAIVPSIYDTNPSQRYRIEQWEPLLAACGVEITYKPFESDALHRVLYKPGHIAEKVKHVAEALVRRSRDVRGAKRFVVVMEIPVAVYRRRMATGHAMRLPQTTTGAAHPKKRRRRDSLVNDITLPRLRLRAID